MENLKAWSQATTTLLDALISAKSAIDFGYLSIIVYKQNELQESPAVEHNPLLKDPFNWKQICAYYGTPEDKTKAIDKANTDTEKELLSNWCQVFGTQQAINTYQQTGEVTKDLNLGGGIATIVKRADIVKYMKANGEEERAHYWEFSNFIPMFSPIEGVKYWSPIKNINTYAVLVGSQGEHTKEQLNNILDESIINILKAD